MIPEGEAAEVTIENNGKKHKLKQGLLAGLPIKLKPSWKRETTDKQGTLKNKKLFRGRRAPKVGGEEGAREERGPLGKSSGA